MPGFCNVTRSFEGTYLGETTACPCGMCRGMAYRTKDEVEEHVIRRGFCKDFIESKTVCAANPLDACNFNEGGDDGCVSNLLNSLIIGARRGEINEDESNAASRKNFELMQERRNCTWDARRLAKYPSL